MFSQWPRSVAGVEVCPLQLPARENRIRVPHYGTYEAMAQLLVPALQPYLDRPFAFFGHCAGALPAFETVRLLMKSGAPLPRQLVVSAQVAPHDCPHDRFLECDDAQLSDELAQLVLARGGQPHPLLIELTLDVLRKDLAANRVYRLERPVTVPVGITVVHWRDDPEVTAAQLRGWRHYSDNVRFTVLDGGHYEFLSGSPPLIEELTKGVTTEHVST